MMGGLTRMVAMILAGGGGEGLSILSRTRTVPAMPFAGKFRVIDFALSNCVNSGLIDVGVLVQYQPRSLLDHIGSGKPWDLDRHHGGVRILQPYLGRRGGEWYRSRADAIYQNLFYVEEIQPEHVLILMADQVYKLDYSAMLAFHKERGGDLTLATREVPLAEAGRFGVVTVDGDRRVTCFEEKPARPESNLASIGVYIFNTATLVEELGRDAAAGVPDFERRIIPKLLTEGRVFAYPFEGFWQDVGTVQSYWQANMDLLAEPAPLDLYDLAWRIHTRSEERGPAKLVEGSRVERSLLCHGCVIAGTVIRSVLSPGVEVAAGVLVRDSIVMTDTRIGPGAVLDRCILDKEVEVGAGAWLGTGEDRRPSRSEPGRLNTGITVVGKRAKVPGGLIAGRNVKIGPGVRPEDFPSLSLPAGDSVELPAGVLLG